jgi:hypothetical protein
MSDHNHNRLRSFASLGWYDETIKFAFNFVTKTSELLLAAGIVVSTANFLTDGDVMSHNKALSDAWSWAQALAIDSSLGIVFMNAFQALREREKIKAVIYFTLTALLATVAGLITHFDALGHAAGLPVTVVARIIPLWIMTALRAVAVIGFLLASRLKNVSFNDLRREPAQELQQQSGQDPELQREAVIPSIDYDALAAALVTAMKQVGTMQGIRVEEELVVPAEPEKIETNQCPGTPLIPLHRSETEDQPEASGISGSPGLNTGESLLRGRGQAANHGRKPGVMARRQRPEMVSEEQEVVNNHLPEAERKNRHVETADVRLRKAYEELKTSGSPITGITLSKRAGARKQTALEWLQQLREHGSEPEEQHFT